MAGVHTCIVIASRVGRRRSRLGAGRRRFGFTLIELMIVVAVVIVLSGGGALYAGSYLPRRQLERAAFELVQDLRLVQNDARISRTYRRVTFDTTNNRYEYQKSIDGTMVSREFNSVVGYPSVVLGGAYVGDSVRLTSLVKAPPGSVTLYFSPFGVPLSEANLGATLESGGASIVLVARTGARIDVHVSQVIGLASMVWQ
jgi:prepilin-type N-terminal cleavage/methylation domain-containing protein